LAETLAKAGHEVVALYLQGQRSEGKSIAECIAYYAERQVKFVPLSGLEGIEIGASYNVAQSLRACTWLREQNFDIIHFPECNGFGYFSLLAKRQGLAFENTTFCIGTHSPAASWCLECNTQFPTFLSQLEIDFMERQSVALADLVVSPCQYMLRWLSANQFKLPQKAYMQQYITPHNARLPVTAETYNLRQIDEVVFFGRLETRKGVTLFCQALDLLAKRHPSPLKITFMGKNCTVDGRTASNYIKIHAAQWPWPCQILSNLDQLGAMEYLRGNRRLAVIPSLVENSPFTGMECIGAHIPYIAAATGGIPEQLCEEDKDKLFPPRPKALADKLEQICRQGIRPAKPAITPEDTERGWVAWHAQETARIIARAGAKPAAPAERPLVSVCLAACGRPQWLRGALDSIKAQDYSAFEVVLVDSGCAPPEEQKYLQELEPEFARRNWQLLRQPGLSTHAERNLAARHARGEYLLFMNEGDYLKPQELSTFIRVALTTQAGLLVCALDAWEGAAPPVQNTASQAYELPLGGAAPVGLFQNCFSAAHFLVHKQTFQELGGFAEDGEAAHEDWEFAAKAVLQGCKFQVVPEALFWGRPQAEIKMSSLHKYAVHTRSLRPYMEAVPEALRPALLFAHGLLLESENLASENMQLRHTVPLDVKLDVAQKLHKTGQKNLALLLIHELSETASKSEEKLGAFKVVCKASAVAVQLKELKAARKALEAAMVLAKRINKPDYINNVANLMAQLQQMEN
jgi:glycosyltransferase involved in cell wall biosynthesis/GT2 family glycosyltransferase